jgi:hypothetical protein
MKRNRGIEAKLQTSYILALWVDERSDFYCNHKGKSPERQENRWATEEFGCIHQCA